MPGGHRPMPDSSCGRPLLPPYGPAMTVVLVHGNPETAATTMGECVLRLHRSATPSPFSFLEATLRG
jgi:hypothetical protein